MSQAAEEDRLSTQMRMSSIYYRENNEDGGKWKQLLGDVGDG